MIRARKLVIHTPSSSPLLCPASFTTYALLLPPLAMKNAWEVPLFGQKMQIIRTRDSTFPFSFFSRMNQGSSTESYQTQVPSKMEISRYRDSLKGLLHPLPSSCSALHTVRPRYTFNLEKSRWRIRGKDSRCSGSFCCWGESALLQLQEPQCPSFRKASFS